MFENFAQMLTHTAGNVPGWDSLTAFTLASRLRQATGPVKMVPAEMRVLGLALIQGRPSATELECFNKAGSTGLLG